MRVPRTTSILHKEVAVALIVVLALIGVSMTSARMETLYTGFLAVDLSTILRQRSQATDRAYPVVAAVQTANGTGDHAIGTVMRPATPSDYPLGDVRVRCGADVPSPTSVSRWRFAQAIRDHCELTLPSAAHDELVQTAQPIASMAFDRGDWQPDALTTPRLLIQCRDLLPLRLAADPRTFSTWTKANCKFVPSWEA